jgi:hypothetical protein
MAFPLRIAAMNSIEGKLHSTVLDCPKFIPSFRDLDLLSKLDRENVLVRSLEGPAFLLAYILDVWFQGVKVTLGQLFSTDSALPPRFMWKLIVFTEPELAAYPGPV